VEREEVSEGRKEADELSASPLFSNQRRLEEASPRPRRKRGEKRKTQERAGWKRERESERASERASESESESERESERERAREREREDAAKKRLRRGSRGAGKPTPRRQFALNKVSAFFSFRRPLWLLSLAL
jgi:hypothetical protein